MKSVTAGDVYRNASIRIPIPSKLQRNRYNSSREKLYLTDTKQKSDRSYSMGNKLNVLKKPEQIDVKAAAAACAGDAAAVTDEMSSAQEVMYGYHILHTIGTGTFGVVYCAVKGDNSSDMMYALKICSKSKLKKMNYINHQVQYLSTGYEGKKEYSIIDQNHDSSSSMVRLNGLHRVYQEIEILSQISHPNIVKYHEFLDDREEGRIVIVTNFIKYGPVLRSLSNGTFTFHPILLSNSLSLNNKNDDTAVVAVGASTIASMMLHIVNAVMYLHQHGIVHRDIKPDNILLDHNHQLILIDFNSAIKFDKQTNPKGLVGDIVGNIHFTAPEAISPNDYKDAMDLGLDMDSPYERNNEISNDIITILYSSYCAEVWSIGILLFCFLKLYLPFYQKNQNEIELYQYICEVDMNEIINKRFFNMKESHTAAVCGRWNGILQGLLSREPSERWTLQNLYDVLIEII